VAAFLTGDEGELVRCLHFAPTEVRRTVTIAPVLESLCIDVLEGEKDRAPKTASAAPTMIAAVTVSPTTKP